MINKQIHKHIFSVKVTVIKVQSVTSRMSPHQTSFVISALHDHIPKHVTGNYTYMLRQTTVNTSQNFIDVVLPVLAG